MDYHQLRMMTVAQVQGSAKGIGGLTGSSQMHKEPLLVLICKELGIATHEHHDVVGIDRAAVKVHLREFKAERAAALEGHDRAQLIRVRAEVHRLKGQLRRATT